MAEHATLPSCAKLRLQKSFFKMSHFIPRNSCLRIIQRGCIKHCYGNFEVRISSRDACDFSANTAVVLGRSSHLKEKSMRCCFGTLINPENAAASNWEPVLDQVLTMVSITLAYIAGVVPPDKTYLNSAKMPDLDAALPRSSSGRAVNSDHPVNAEYAWAVVKGKLLGALDAVQQEASSDERAVECEKYSAKCPLSLSAVAEGPKLRLLWTTLQLLEKEVNSIAGNLQSVDRSNWMATSSEIIQKSSQSVLLTWLEEELHLENKKHDGVLLLTMIEKLKRDDNILKNIRKSGKEDLYADLLFFLRFHFLGMGCPYDSKLLGSRGVDILEDLVITLADGITTNYLELISVDSNMSSEMHCLGLNLCSLSTRALQKLRNEVAFKQWLQQNMDSVVSMYEDRFDLYNFQIQLMKQPDEQKDKLHWWKKLTLKKAASTFFPLQYMVISPLSMSVKRTKELRALNGCAISFLLVCFVGRSLGLIYSGIRQSLGWRGNS